MIAMQIGDCFILFFHIEILLDCTVQFSPEKQNEIKQSSTCIQFDWIRFESIWLAGITWNYYSMIEY